MVANKTSLFLLLLIFLPIAAFAAMPSLNFTVNMSETVIVNTTGGTPTIALTVDDKPRVASYVTGTGTNALTFTYTPTAGDVDLDGITLTSPIIVPSGSSIKDTAGNDAALAFTAPNTSGLKINYPSLSMDFTNGATGRYTLNGNPYTSLSIFLTDTSGSFSRASVGTYFDNAGVMQTAAADTPRFDYDPITHAAKGILIEEQRTNSIKNSTMQNAVVGAPGTFPTNWQSCFTGGGATCTSSITGKGIVNGMDYIDVRLQGNMPASGAYVNILVADQTVSATWLPITNTDYISGQIKLALVSGIFPFTGITYMVSEQNASTYLTNRTLKSITSGSLTGTLTNFSGSAAAVNSTVNNVIQPRLVIGSNGTLTNYDFTLRVATPQIEKGPFPTSFIPTTTAAVTRTADILKVATTGGWYSTSAHTAISRSISSTNNNSYAIILEGDTIKGVSQSYASPSSYELNARNISGTNSVISSTSVNSAGIANTFGITYDASLPSFAANGSLVNRNSSAAVLGTPAYFYLGSRNGTSLFLNGWISKAKYYPARVSDTQLQLLTQ